MKIQYFFGTYYLFTLPMEVLKNNFFVEGQKLFWAKLGSVFNFIVDTKLNNEIKTKRQITKRKEQYYAPSIFINKNKHRERTINIIFNELFSSNKIFIKHTCKSATTV